MASGSLPLLFPPTALPESGELGVDGGMRPAELLADTLQTLAQLPSDHESLEIWVVRPRPPRKIAPKAMVRRWLRKALAALSRGSEDASVAEGRESQAMCRSPASQPEPVRNRSVRLRVLQPDRELPGSFLDFDPGKIRAWYKHGLHTARCGRTEDHEYSGRAV